MAIYYLITMTPDKRYEYEIRDRPAPDQLGKLIAKSVKSYKTKNEVLADLNILFSATGNPGQTIDNLSFTDLRDTPSDLGSAEALVKVADDGNSLDFLNSDNLVAPFAKGRNPSGIIPTARLPQIPDIKIPSSIARDSEVTNKINEAIQNAMSQFITPDDRELAITSMTGRNTFTLSEGVKEVKGLLQETTTTQLRLLYPFDIRLSVLGNQLVTFTLDTHNPTNANIDNQVGATISYNRSTRQLIITPAGTGVSLQRLVEIF